MLFFKIICAISFLVFLCSINVGTIGSFAFGSGLGMLFLIIDKQSKKDKF